MNKVTSHPSKSVEPFVEGEAAHHIYEVGTLKYTKKSLFILFALLLGGDFALGFFEGIFGPFSTLYVKQYNASNTLLSVLNLSVPGIVNVLFGPSMSRWSDNLRTPWGRRIPFLASSVPMIFVSIVMMGFAPELAGVIYHGAFHHFAPSVPYDTIVLTLLTAYVVLFHFGNMILVNSYTWLQRDTIPQGLMARFISWFRIVSILTGALFSWYVFPHVIQDRKPLCLGLGAFYLVVFGLMCRFVKEGHYPPPIKEQGNAAQLYISYFRQCFTVPIYRWAFLKRILAGMSVCAGAFMIFFQRETIGMSLEDMGKLGAVTSILSAVILFPMGWLCDKFSPFRVQFFCAAVSLSFAPLNYFFTVNEHTLILFAVITLPIGVAAGLADTTVTMELFPSQKFGQFFAALNIMGMGIKILGAVAFGYFLDYLHSNYRTIYIWSFFWDSMGFIFLYLLFREWKRLGGAEHYVPPLPPE
jgi:maltose/moltooligosaccharide transporter